MSTNWWEEKTPIEGAGSLPDTQLETPAVPAASYFEPPSALPDPSLRRPVAQPAADLESIPSAVTGGSNWWEAKPETPPAKEYFEEPSSPANRRVTEIASSPVVDETKGGEGSPVPLKEEGPVDWAKISSASSDEVTVDGSHDLTDDEVLRVRKGPRTVADAAQGFLPSGKNTGLKALGIATGSLVAGAASTSIFTGAGTVAAAAGLTGAAVALPYVLAAAAVLGIGAAASWAGKTIAEKFSTEDEEKASLLAAQVRQTTGKYTPEELAAGLKETDRQTTTLARNLARVEAAQEQGWWSTATDMTVDMLPFVAEFASLSQASNRIASFVINPRKAAAVYDAANALVRAGKYTKFEHAVADVMGGIAKAADKGAPGLTKADELATVIAANSKGAITKEAAFDYLRNYKKPGLLERHLTEALGSAVQAGAAVSTINRREFEESKLRWAGPESDGTAKAFLDATIENWSERMGGLIFDPMLGKVFGGAAVKYGPKVPRALAEIGNGFKYISQKLRVDSPIGEYWEESVGSLVRSALDLNDDGKTSKQTRIFESLTSFVPHTEEQAKMLFSFGVTGIFGAATASAMGARTDMEQAAFENSLSTIVPHLESAFSGPTAVVAVDRKEERTLARAFVDALIKSKDEDQRNFVIQKIADVFKLDDQFRYRKGSVAQVYEGIRGSSKDTTIESVLAEVENLRKIHRSGGEEKAMDWVVKNITGRTTNAILAQRGLAPLAFNLDPEAAKQLNELVRKGEITPKHSSDASLRGLTFTPTGNPLTDAQNAIVAEHARIMDPKGATEAESAANLQLMLKTTVPLKMSGNVPRKSVAKQLLQHVTRSGNYQHAGTKATEASINQALDFVDAFRKTRSKDSKAGVKGVEVHLAPLAISQNIGGHEELGRGAIYGTNYIDKETGVAHIFVAAEAETPDIVEEVVELSMKERGAGAAEVRTVLRSLQLDYGERAEKKLKELEKRSQLSAEDMKNVKAIRAMIQAIGQARERSASGYTGKDKLNERQVTEFASSFVTALLSMNHIGTKSDADFMSGNYFSDKNQAHVFASAFHAMRQLSDVGPELMVSAADAVNQLIDVKQLGKDQLSAYKRFAEAAGRFTAGSAAQRRAAALQERRAQEQKPVEPKPTEKPVEPKPTEKPVEPKPTEKPVEPKPTVKPDAKPAVKPDAKPTVKPDAKPTVKPEPKPVVKSEAERMLEDFNTAFDDLDLQFSAREITQEEAVYRAHVTGVRLGSLYLKLLVSGKWRIAQVLNNEATLLSPATLMENIRLKAGIPPEIVFDKDTTDSVVQTVRATLGFTDPTATVPRKIRQLLKQTVLHKTVPFELQDALSDMDIFKKLAEQLQPTDEQAPLDESELDVEPVEAQVGQESMDEESMRAALGMNDAVKALGFSSEFDRVKLWEMLSPFSTHPESEAFRDAAIDAMMGTPEEYRRFLAAGYPRDAFINEFLNRLNLHNQSTSNQQGFRQLLVTMNSTYIPLVGHGVFTDTKGKVDAGRLADMKSRIAGSLVRTFNERFTTITDSPNLLLDTLYFYIQAFNAAGFVHQLNTLDSVTVAQLGVKDQNLKHLRQEFQTSPYQKVYMFMETLLGVDALELFTIDVEYKLANPDRLPPALAAFYIELKPVVQTLNESGVKLVEWDNRTVVDKQKIQRLSFNPALVKREALSATLDQYSWLGGAATQYDAFRLAILQAFQTAIKTGGGVSKAASASDTGKRERDTSNLHEIAQGLAKTGRHISIKKAKGGVVFNAISTSHLTSVAFENGWELGRLMTISRSEDGTISANFGTADEAVDAEEFEASDVALIMQGEFDKTPEGETYRAWLAPFGEKKDIYTRPFQKKSLAAIKEEYTRRLAALFFGKSAESLTDAEIKKFESPEAYDKLPKDFSWKQFFPHPAYLKTAYDFHHAFATLDTMLTLHSEQLIEDYKNSEDLVKRRGSDVAAGYSMIKKEYVAKTGRDYIAAAVINDPKLRALVGKILGKEADSVDAADGLAIGVNDFMDVAAELYGQGITKVGLEGQPSKLNMIKAIVAGPREIFKQSLHRLPSYFAPEDRGMLRQIAKLVEQHNKLGEPLDMIVFSSAAKKKGQKSQSQNIFDTSSTDEVKLHPDVASNRAFTFENVSRIPVEQFKWQLNLQKPPKLKNSVVPRQPIAVAAQNHDTRDKYFSAVMEQILGVDAKLELGFDPGSEGKKFKGFSIDKLISGSGMLDTLQSDAFNLIDYTVEMAKAIRKALQFRVPLTQAVEVPLGQSTDDVRDFVGRKKNSVGAWVDTNNLGEAGVRMAYAQVQVNVEAQKDGLRYNEVAEGVAKNWNASKAVGVLSQKVRDDWKTYLDMFERPELVKSATDAESAPIREWEFFQNKAGQWVIPGEPMLIARIPADNMYSTTVVRAGERYIVNTNERDIYDLPNLIRTPLSLQVAAGSDFDADKRFILPFVGRAHGRKSLESGWNSVLASMMNDFDKPENYKLFMEPLDTALLDGAIEQTRTQAAPLLALTPAETAELAKTNPERHQLVKAVQESLGGASLQIGTVEGALALYRSNQVGKRGLGQAAALLYGFNLMESVGIHLQQNIASTSFKGFEFINPFTGKATRIVAGRTGGEGLGNYVTTTKRLFGTFLNLFADHGKLQKITKLGIDDSNIHIVMALMFAHGDFKDLDTELDYLVNTVVPFLYTPEAIVARQDQQKLSSVALPMSAKSEIWDKELELDSEGNPVSQYEQVQVMARSFQKMNQILRNMFKDSTIGIADYETLDEAVGTLHGTQRSGEAFPGQYGAWSLGGIPQIFRPALDGLGVLKKHAYKGSLRQSPAWQEVKDKIFSAPVPKTEDPKGTVYAPIAEFSNSNLEVLHEEMHNAVALLSMTDHLRNLAGLAAGTDASMSLRRLTAQTVDRLAALGSEYADNPFFKFVTSRTAERFVLQAQPRSSTGARVKAEKIWDRENPIRQIGVASVFRSSPISDAEIERIRAGFDKLPEQAKAVLTLYAIYRYGVTDFRHFQGSYLQFISTAYRKSIHEATADKFKGLLSESWSEQQMSWFTDYVQEKLRRTPRDGGVKDPARKNLLLPVPMKSGVARTEAVAVKPVVAPAESTEEMVKRMVAEQVAAALKEREVVKAPVVEAPVTPAAQVEAAPVVVANESGSTLKNEDGSPLHVNGEFSVTQITVNFDHSARLLINQADGTSLELVISANGSLSIESGGVKSPVIAAKVKQWLGDDIAKNIFKFANDLRAGNLSREATVEQAKMLLVVQKAAPRPVSPDAKTPTELFKELPPPKMSSSVKLDLGRGRTAPATQDQSDALDAMNTFLNNKEPVFVLEGYAGTGKTSLVKTLLSTSAKSKRVIFGAPTHKARIVLAFTVGARALGRSYTTAKLTMKLKDDESGRFVVGGKEGNPWEGADIAIIDEASMIPEVALKSLLEEAAAEGVKIIFMGDPAQLPPVRKGLDTKFANKPAPVFTQFTQHKATLTAIMRQTSGNPLMALAAVFRGLVDLPDALRRKITELNAEGEGVIYHRDEEAFLDDFIDIANMARKTDPKGLADVKLVAWTNKARAKWGVAIRNRLFPEAKGGFAPGMIVTGYENVKADQYTYNIYNSADYLITSISAITNNKFGVPGRTFTLEPIDTMDEPKQVKKVRMFIIEESSHDAVEERANLLYETAIRLKGRNWPAYFDFMQSNISTRPMRKSTASQKSSLQALSKQIGDLEARLTSMKKSPANFDPKQIIRVEEELEEAKYAEIDALAAMNVTEEGSEDKKRPVLTDAAFKFGMSTTTHKAQGSTYQHVFIDEDNMDANKNVEERKQLKYTAATRARTAAHLLSKDAEVDAAAPAVPKVEAPVAPAAPSMDPLRRKAIEKEIEDLRVQYKNTPSIEGRKAIQQLAETLKKQLADAGAPVAPKVEAPKVEAPISGELYKARAALKFYQEQLLDIKTEHDVYVRRAAPERITQKLREKGRAVQENIKALKNKIEQLESGQGGEGKSHSARRYTPTTATPVSMKQALAWAAKEHADATGTSLDAAHRGLDNLRMLMTALDADGIMDIKAREDATVAAASPYYPMYPALRGFVTRLFRDAPNREERYLENRLNGSEPGYIGAPETRKPYQTEMFESLNPKAAAEVNAMLEDKPYPNMQDSSLRMSHSARYSAAAEAIFNDLPDVYGNKSAKEILKLAMRSGRMGVMSSSIASQKIRRKLGARMIGTTATNNKKHALGDRVLEALTVLIETAKGEDFAKWVAGEGENSRNVWNWDEKKIIEFAEKNDLRILRDSKTDLIANPDESEGAPPFIPSEKAERVADVLREYMNTAQFKKHSFKEVGEDIVTTMENLRKFANSAVGYAWISPFKYGQDNYMIHQYVYDSSTPPETRERWQSEETGRIIERDDEHKTYTEAALNFGHMPKTLNAAELIEGWGTSVNQIMQNKILLTGLSRIKDVYGNAMVVPARVLGAQEGNVHGSVIPKDEAEDTLRSLILAAEQYSEAHRKEFTWHREPTDSVWDALNKLTQHLSGNQDQYNTSLLSALGYERITVKRTFGLQNQDFFVVKGAPFQAVSHLVGENFEELAADGDKFRYKLLNGLLKINRMIKSVNVSFSLFQHFSLIESWLADAGAHGFIKIVKNTINARKIYTEMMENGDVAAKWIQHGLQLSVVPYDVDLNLIDKAIAKMGTGFDKVGLTFVGDRVRNLLNLKKGFDGFLWHQLTPLMKIQIAEAALKSVSRHNPLVVDIPLKDMTPEQRKATYEARDDIAKYVNDSLGSQEWSQYLWATPHVRDVMNTFMFSPDWTLSALNISGVPESIGKMMNKNWLGYDSFTHFARNRRLTHYIPGFFTWVFVAWPFAIQAAIALAYGGGDDDDENLFPFNNEEGQKFSADITPLIHHYQRKRGVAESDLSRERTYLQPGKQVREVFAWFADPVRTGFSKLAPPIRMVTSAVTGVVSPSISLDKTWAANNETDKWTKIAAGIFPFSVSALTRPEDLGGVPGAVLATTLPRNTGKTRFVLQADLTGIYRDFLKGRGVRNQSPELAFNELQKRLGEQKENYLGDKGSGNELLWKTANSGALSGLRTGLNAQLKSEYEKPDADRDVAKIHRLLYTILLTHKSTKEAYQSLESSFESAAKKQMSVRNPEKVNRLTSRDTLRQLKQDLYGVSAKNNVRPFKLK